jgi:SAM-dependent methyltransferase
VTDIHAGALLASRGRDHWWHAGMRFVTRSMLGEGVAGRVLDIGCGPGLDLQDLPAGLVGVGLDLGRYPVLPARFVIANGAKTPFVDGTFDVVLLLDVLEHEAARPERILVEVCRLLKPGGLLFVRVPAYPWLHSSRDDFWGSARRYYRGELALLIQDAGLTIRRLSYANCLLFAPAAAMRLSVRLTGRGRDDLRLPPPALNRLLRQVLFMEARWLRTRDLPFGLSVVCLAARTR